MLSATKTAREMTPDRLFHAKIFANELSGKRLRKIKGRWTAEKRAEKSALARKIRPWVSATGLRTAAGKAKSSANAIKHGLSAGEYRKFFALMRAQRAYLSIVQNTRIKRWPTDASMVRQRMLTLEKLLLRMRKALEAAGVETPALDARILTRQGGNFSDAELITLGQAPLSQEVVDSALKLLSRRLEGEPVSRIAGEREFWSLPFRVTPDTLDPRPDTETLVAAALNRAREMGRTDLRILDLGTGTGCILISLLTELPHATGVAVDASAAALNVSRENAARHGVDSRIDFRHGSWFEPLDSAESFDLIVSNPPYIPESVIESLAKEVRNHDPIQALAAGADGLDDYKVIIPEIKKHLACGGFALLEIGKGQEFDLARLVEDSNMTRGESYVDLGGILRVVEIVHGEN